MEKLYRETKTSLLLINELLSKFEKSLTHDEIQTSKSQINEKFNEIITSCNQLDIYVTKEPASRRYDSKLKVDQLKYDFQHYRTAFNSIQYKKFCYILIKVSTRDDKFLEKNKNLVCFN